MADAGSDTGGGGETGDGTGWWGNFMSVAKTKSAEVFEFMKRDFDEFSSAVKNEAATIATHTASAVKETLQLDNEESAANTVKRSMSSFFGQVKEALSPSSASADFDEPLVIHDGNPVAMTKLQRKIYALMKEDATYLVDIGDADGERGDGGGDGARARFRSWLSVAERRDEYGVLADRRRLANMLATNPTLQEKYFRLVPDAVTETDFWQRYLFRKAVVEDTDAELERWLQRERRQAENYPWQQGKEDESLVRGDRPDSLELTEEEQIRLLEEYELERNGGAGAAAQTSCTTDARHEQRTASTTDNKAQDDLTEKDSLTMRDKKDMVIVSSGPDMSQTSSSSKASTDGDWEKEFDIDETETTPTSSSISISTNNNNNK